MRTKRRPDQQSGNKRNGDGRDDENVMRDASVPPRNPSGIHTSVQHSPSGDPDGRRDDDVEPSPEGPLTRERGDSDVEGVHERPNTNVERE